MQRVAALFGAPTGNVHGLTCIGSRGHLKQPSAKM